MAFSTRPGMLSSPPPIDSESVADRRPVPINAGSPPHRRLRRSAAWADWRRKNNPETVTWVTAGGEGARQDSSTEAIAMRSYLKVIGLIAGVLGTYLALPLVA